MKNIEVKARCDNPNAVRKYLEQNQAEYVGTDHQIDTYFIVNNGRLKLREGDIENNLIYYNRTDSKAPKLSEINLYPVDQPDLLKPLLLNALEVLVVVDKTRAIYFIDNVKFHIDEVTELGSFVEIEAIDRHGSISEHILREQCQTHMESLDISDDNLISSSYSDMLS